MRHLHCIAVALDIDSDVVCRRERAVEQRIVNSIIVKEQRERDGAGRGAGQAHGLGSHQMVVVAGVDVA